MPGMLECTLALLPLIIILLLINNLYECDQYDVQMYTIYTIEDTIFVQ